MDIDDLIAGSTVVIKKIPINDQKSYIIKNVDSLNIEQRKELGRILINTGKKSLLQMNAQGTLVDLNLASDISITMMYNYMKDQLSI
jgi:hypothetical protein